MVEYQQQGSGPPFVYVCGIEGSGKLFYKQAEDLARDHTVVSFPLRRDGAYGMGRLVEDLAWVIREAGGRATVLGESFGGLLTMAAALEHPELFERIILVNTFPHFRQRLKIHAGCLLFQAFYPMLKAHRTRTRPERSAVCPVPSSSLRRARGSAAAICRPALTLSSRRSAVPATTSAGVRISPSRGRRSVSRMMRMRDT